MITGYLSGAEAVLSSLAKTQKNIAFAASQALNDTAKDIQAFTLKTELPSKFTLRARGNPWQTPGTKLGFNIKFANRDSLTAVIGSQAEWLPAQEHGGNKMLISGHRVAVPTAFWKKREELMIAAKKPRAILKGLQGELREANRVAGESHKVNKKGNLILKSQRSRIADIRRVNAVKKAIQLTGSLTATPFLAKGKLHPGIYVRTGNARLPIKMLFSFQDTVRIKQRLSFQKDGIALGQSVYNKHFNNRLVAALATMK